MALDAERRYDAFLSYASADRRRARRVHRVLERWFDRKSGRRLAVFFDETDIRGGRLDTELSRAAHEARTLIVCHSPAAADSRWVASEVALFREKHEPDRIAALILSGNSEPASVGSEIAPGFDVRVHDLRRGWWLAWLGLGVELELLRLLAFVGDVDLRTLRNWHLRRTLRNLALLAITIVVPSWFVAVWPLDDWERLDLELGSQPIYAIAAEADGSQLNVVRRFRGGGGQGFRNYLETIYDALGPDPKPRMQETSMARRLLPTSLLQFELRNKVPSIDIASVTDRTPVEKTLPLVAQPKPGCMIVVIALAPTEDEIQEETDMSADMGTPIRTVAGAVVATFAEGDTRIASVDGLCPTWQEFESNQTRTPTSPSKGIAVAWSPEGDVWLGLSGEQAQQSGGLWHRAPGTNTWEREPGFASVSSIELEVRDNATRAITVAEGHLDVWRGGLLEPRPTRVVTRAAGESSWRDAIAPPFGTRSDVELVGALAGARLVRVDEYVFRLRSIALWRFLSSR